MAFMHNKLLKQTSSPEMLCKYW